MKRRMLGFGDFIYDGPNPLARSLYLHAVSRCVPNAMVELVGLDGSEAALRAWADTWGFSDRWALDYARLHATRWLEDPSLIGHWITTVSTWAPTFPAGPSWDPIMETEAAFLKRVAEYVAMVKRSPGIKATPEKRLVGRRDHFEWLALHHVGRLTEAAIAERYADERGLNIGSISEAITKTAELIGLTLRSAPGRKLGQTSSS